jgi:uncharacterized protein YceH (UPF0502 family)
MSNDDNATAPPLLNAVEARALGCLIEKEATTPDAYPLTVNMVQLAANQKTAREPVMALDPGNVNHALRQLEQKGLAKQVFSTRTERYEHRTGQYFNLRMRRSCCWACCCCVARRPCTNCSRAANAW